MNFLFLSFLASCHVHVLLLRKHRLLRRILLANVGELSGGLLLQTSTSNISKHSLGKGTTDRCHSRIIHIVLGRNHYHLYSPQVYVPSRGISRGAQLGQGSSLSGCTVCTCTVLYTGNRRHHYDTVSASFVKLPNVRSHKNRKGF